MWQDSDLHMPVVADFGSVWTRAGFCEDNTPRVVMPTVTWRLRHKTPAVTPERVYIGDEELDLPRSSYTRKFPIDCGLPTNYTDYELLLDYVFRQKLQADMTVTPLVLVEGESMAAMCTREKATQIAFETYHVPFFYLAPSSSLILSSCGMKTGMSVDIVQGMTRAVPVYESYFLKLCVMKGYHLSCRLMSDHLAKLLTKKGLPMSVSTLEAAETMLKDHGYVAQDFNKEKADFTADKQKLFTMSDGTVVTLGTERFECTETLFQPQLADQETGNLPEYIVNTVMNCVPEIRQDVLDNIVLAGGGSLLPGLAPRLESEVQKEVSQRASLRDLHVQVQAPPDGDLLAWKGGCRLASDAAFTRLCISADEYEEYGPVMVQRKCF